MAYYSVGTQRDACLQTGHPWLPVSALWMSNWQVIAAQRSQSVHHYCALSRIAMQCASVLDHLRKGDSLETFELQDFYFLNKDDPSMKTAWLEAKGQLKIQLAHAAYDGVVDVFALASQFVFQRFGIILGLVAWSRLNSSSFCSLSRCRRSRQRRSDLLSAMHSGLSG